MTLFHLKLNVEAPEGANKRVFLLDALKYAGMQISADPDQSWYPIHDDTTGLEIGEMHLEEVDEKDEPEILTVAGHALRMAELGRNTPVEELAKLAVHDRLEAPTLPSNEEMEAWIISHGFKVAPRNPFANMNHDGAWMVIDIDTFNVLQKHDFSFVDASELDGGWCVVGDDREELIQSTYTMHFDFQEGK